VKILAIVLGLVIIVTGIIGISNQIDSARTDAWLVRAKDAGNPAQVAEFLVNYKSALYNIGRVEGKYVSLFKYPGDSMTIYIRTVDGLIQRAKDLSIQNPTETSYQMGLVNLEKDLGDIETASYAVWIASGGFWIMPTHVCAWIALIVVGTAALLRS